MVDYIFVALGIFMILLVLIAGGSTFFAICKCALPKVENKNLRRFLVALCFVLLAVGVAPCLSLGIRLLDYRPSENKTVPAEQIETEDDVVDEELEE